MWTPLISCASCTEEQSVVPMESREALLMWRLFPNAHKPHKQGHPSRITIAPVTIPADPDPSHYPLPSIGTPCVGPAPAAEYSPMTATMSSDEIVRVRRRLLPIRTYTTESASTYDQSELALFSTHVVSKIITVDVGTTSYARVRV
jgi:hypothetical protein